MADYKLIAANCPNCGASLQLPDGLQKAYCTYCGTEVLVGKLTGGAKVQCSSCGGSGRVEFCRACNGTGRCTWSTNSPGVRHNDLLAIGYTSRCDNGLCSACGGTGRYNYGGCPGCEGTGRCPRCIGSGRCAACHGTGLLASPKGRESCPDCEGTGTIDPTVPRPASKGTICPECKRPWSGSGTNCRFCGYWRNLCPKCGAVWMTGTLTCAQCGFSPDKPGTASVRT